MSRNRSRLQRSMPRMAQVFSSVSSMTASPRSTTEMSDVEILDQIIGGDSEKFALIVRRYNAELFRIGMAYLRNHGQAEDAMQNAYLKAFISLNRFQRTA